MKEILGPFDSEYEMLGKIGSGGMGSVYKVRHRLLDEFHVIKVLSSSLADNRENRERFLREARMAAQVRHENVVQLFNCAVEDGVGFIVMEHIDGKDLERLLRENGPLSLPLVLGIAQEALKALAYVHRKGIVHRDIAPDNIMLALDAEGNPTAKLIDLGLAKPEMGERELTQAGMFLGKVRYASPEQFNAESVGAVGPASDVYSFGVVLYEQLTGVSPIPGDSWARIMASHLYNPPVPFAETDRLNRIPAAVRSVVLKALEKEPKSRFPDAESFREQIKKIQAHYPLTANETAECRSALGRKHSRKHGREDSARRFPAKGKGVAVPTEAPSPDGLRGARKPSGFDVTGGRDGHQEENSGGIPSVAGRQVGVPPVTNQPASADIDVFQQPTVVAPPESRKAGPGFSDGPTVRRCSWIHRHKRLGLLSACVLLVVAVLATTLTFLRSQTGKATHKPVMVENGVLVLDAVPWARIVQVSDSEGNPVNIGRKRGTPVAISLAPGTYEIILRSGDSTEHTLTARVDPDKVTRELVRIAEIDADELLRSLGILR